MSHQDKIALDAQVFPQGKPANLTHKSLIKSRQKTFSPTQGQVVSQTTLVLWKRLYGAEYNDTLWKRSLKKIFPNKSLDRSKISVALETIYSVRNRVAHHEPVYGQRLEECISALFFIREAIGAKKDGEATSFRLFSNLHYLRLRMDHASFIEAWENLT